jgi:hypothetical protein
MPKTIIHLIRESPQAKEHKQELEEKLAMFCKHKSLPGPLCNLLLSSKCDYQSLNTKKIAQ